MVNDYYKYSKPLVRGSTCADIKCLPPHWKGYLLETWTILNFQSFEVVRPHINENDCEIYFTMFTSAPYLGLVLLLKSGDASSNKNYKTERLLLSTSVLQGLTIRALMSTTVGILCFNNSCIISC